MARMRGTQIYSPDILEELKAAMAEESRPGHDDEVVFKQKMNALQRFLNHGMSRFSIDTWHHALTTLFQTYQHGQRAGDSDAYPGGGHDDKPVVNRLRGVADLRALSRDVMMQREGGGLREVDAVALKNLDNFMAALQCVREAKACVAEMYRFLHRYYYNPDAGRENSHVHFDKTLSRSSTLQASDGAPEHNAFETSAKQFGILTLQQMSGSTDHKLRRTVADMQQILARWDRLAAEGEIQAEDLDAESQQDLLLLSGTAAFEPVLRLLPDIFAKYYKCLELAKQWWVLAHEIYPELPINRPPTPSTRVSSRESADGTASRTGSDSTLSAPNEAPESKVPFSEQLHQVEEGIQIKEDLMQSLMDELKLLEERERHFESLVEAYANVTAELEKKTQERKELVTVKEKETFLPNNQMLPANATGQTTSAESQTHNNTQELEAQLRKTEREIQLLQFQQSLLQQDYMLQLEVRPSLIRFTDDLRIRAQEAQQSLTEHKMEKTKLETLLQEENNAHSDRGATPQQDVNESQSWEEVQLPETSTSSKAVERKLELSRLQARPFREDTSGSSVTLEPEAAVPHVQKPKRRKSQPERQREEMEKGRRSPPLIKINNAVGGQPQSSLDNSESQKKKFLRVPTIPSSAAAKSSQSQQKASHPKVPAAATTTTQNTAETASQRRAARKQGAEATNEKPHEDQISQPQPRPRAKSDPHAVKPGQKALKNSPEPVRRLNTAEFNEQGGQQRHDKRNSTGSSPDPKSGDVRKDSDTAAAQKTKPAGVRRASDTSHKSKSGDVRKESDTSQKTKPGDVRKGSDTSQKSRPVDIKEESDTSQKTKPGDVRKETGVSQRSRPGNVPKDSDATSNKSKPADVRQGSETTSHKSKSGDVKNDIVRTSQNSSTGDVKKDRDFKSRKSIQSVIIEDADEMSHNPQLNGARKDTHVASQKARKQDEQTKTEMPSSKPKANHDKRFVGVTSHKTVQGDVSKSSNLTSEKPSEGDDKKRAGAPAFGQNPTAETRGDTRQHQKATDVRKTVDVTSHKSSSTGRGHDKVSRPNGVTGRGKKQNYADV